MQLSISSPVFYLLHFTQFQALEPDSVDFSDYCVQYNHHFQRLIHRHYASTPNPGNSLFSGILVYFSYRKRGRKNGCK